MFQTTNQQVFIAFPTDPEKKGWDQPAAQFSGG